MTQQKLTYRLGYPHLTDGHKQSRFSRMARPMGQVVIALFAAPLMIHQPIMAAVIVVDGTCTLVNAINAANTDSATGNCLAGSGADEIQVTVDVTLTQMDNSTDGENSLPSINTEVKVIGIGGSPLREVTRGGGAPNFRIFHVGENGTLELDSLALANGSAVGVFPDNRGGAIFNRGQLTLTNSTISGSTSSNEGGAIVNEYNATLTLSNSTVTGNSATLVGGGIFANDNSMVTLTDSTISENSVNNEGGGIFGEGSTVIVTNSTLSGNSATNGGGIFNYAGTVNLTNSTMSGNSASFGGGIYNYTEFGGTATLTNSTLSGNTASSSGGGIFNDAGSPVTLINSILTNSSGGNCSGSIADSGNNLADDATCATIPSTLLGVDPVLADNGGPTMTHALLAGSNAIDLAGDCGEETDQRGAPRFDGTCDSGSFEYGGCPLSELADRTVTTIEVYEECQVWAGPNVTVAEPNGDLMLITGTSVTLFGGFTVEEGGTLTIVIDPSLQMESAIETAIIAGWVPPKVSDQ